MNWTICEIQDMSCPLKHFFNVECKLTVVPLPARGADGASRGIAILTSLFLNLIIYLDKASG